MKKCPFCAEKIQDEAIKCKHCGENYPVLKDKKDVWYRIIKVLYFFLYSILVLIALIGFVVSFTDEWISIWNGIGFSLGIIGGIIFVEIVNIILIYLFKGDIKEIDYCLLKYKFKNIFVFIPIMLLLGLISISYIGINEYREYKIEQEAYGLGAINNDDVEKYKEFKEKYNSIELPQAFRSTMCGDKGYEGLFTNTENTSDTLTYFYDTETNDCYLLREYNSHGGNGLMTATLYSLENNDILGSINNHVRDDIWRAGDNLVYTNRIDDLLGEINLSSFRINYTLGNEFARGDIMPEWEDTYDKVGGLRLLDNYREKKDELYEKEEVVIDEHFLMIHYRKLGISYEINYETGERIKLLDDLKDAYKNYLNPPVSYDTFYSWYENTSYVSVDKINLLNNQKYEVEITIFDNIDGELKYELIVEIAREENGTRKIKDYESKKI